MFCFLLIVVAQSCAFRSIKRSKNITYTDPATPGEKQSLNIFAPSTKKEKHPVLIFVYGGNWNSGKKKIYNYFGSRMARKGIATVVVDYPKSPRANFDEMATDIAIATKWIKEHISEYGGDSSRIFISGHSAGGHLAALVSVKKKYFENAGIANPVKGLILIDAAGLDMYGYLKEESFEAGHTYLNTFTNDPEVWKKASPLYFLHNDMPPMLIYRGGKTYPSIIESNEKFATALKSFHTRFAYKILKSKKHVPMILQFFNTSNPRYKEITDFMKINH